MLRRIPRSVTTLPQAVFFKSSFSKLVLLSLAASAGLLGFCALLSTPRARAAATIQNSVAVTTVSAASYAAAPAPLAPNSIVAGFGTQLARATEAATSQPLPTTLAGTMVKVTDSANVERLAPLFFVSAFQINYVIPDGSASGDAQVTVTSTQSNGDQVISRGSLRIAASAPSLFSAAASGSGAPAALTGRVTSGGAFVFDPNPPFEPDSLNPSLLQPRPVDVGTDALPAFLILYGTGLRNAPAGSVHVIIGGIDVTPAFVGAAPGFTGLDQVNVQIPTALRGRGRVDFTVVANGVSSNSLTVSAAGAAGGNLAITGFSVTDGAVAGQTMTISGNGFSTTANQNIVRFGNAQGRVVSASDTQLSVIVPLGAESGRVTLQTPQGEIRSNAALRVRTSISGIVQTTGTSTSAPAPMENVTVRVVGENISVRTNRQGSFIIPNATPGAKLMEVDAGTTNSSPPFPSVTLKMVAQADRDNQFSQPISMQQITGPGVNVGSGGTIAQLPRRGLSSGNKVFINVTDRNVTLDIPTGTNVLFPDGKSIGRVNLTVLEKSRLPSINLPSGVYSSTIVQITPLGAKFSPGASLSFPNPDPANLNAGAKVDFYRYDETSGTFIRRGTGTVTPDKSRVASDGRIVDEGSYWFAAARGSVTTVTGRVLDGIGFPVPGAQVAVNGRADSTDENGGFIIADVATAGTAQLQVEAVLPQQFGTVPRGTSSLTNVVANGITNVGTIALSNTNQPGLVLSPFAFRFDSNSPPTTLSVTLTQPAPAGGLQVNLASNTTSVATVPSSVTIPAGQTTANFSVTRTGPGIAVISALATLSGTGLESYAIVVVAKSAPVLASVSPATAPISGRITISGTGFSTDPGNNFVVLMRNGQLAAIFDPDENELVEDQTGKPALSAKVPPVSNGPAQLVMLVADDLTGVISDVSAPLNFNVLTTALPAPVLASLSPAGGKPKDQITINGSGFSTSPGENVVSFRQNGLESQAEIIQASASQLLVRVPSAGIDKGPAIVFARRVGADGSSSDLSNALDFDVTQGPINPATPTIASVLNSATQAASGRDGDRITVQGTNFGKNFLDIETGDLGNTDPFITLLGFYQNSQLLAIQIPINASGGTQLSADIPTGLSAGPVQITALTVDIESGLLSGESAPVNFTITVGSLRVVDEDEPNDSPDTATDVPFPSIVEGDADSTDPGDLIITLNGGATEKVQDLFEVSLTQTTDLQLILNFNQGSDLDLFLLKAKPNSDGTYTVLSSAVNRTGVTETIFSSGLPAGDYLIGVACVGAQTFYQLGVTQGGVAGPDVTGAQSPSQLQPEKAEVVPDRRRVQVTRPRSRRVIR
ncbi:MAG TPA: IPT/TIG domain-containing protein [Blastocatellia bacterium]|nr:IPT/TIG domain-containing protein [Blastocatellia bacterium]